MMINKLAKVISAAAVLAMAVSLAPQSALAQKFSGRAGNTSDKFSFEINPSASYTPSASNTAGIFSGAIQNAIYTDNLPPILNTESPKDYKLNPGNLEVYLEDITDFDRDALNNPNPPFKNSFKGKFGNRVVKYKAELEDNSNPKNFVKFAFYAPNIEPFTNLDSLSIFNASKLNPFFDSQGGVGFPKFVTELNQQSDFYPDSDIYLTQNQESFYLTFSPDNVTKVPEATATASLLSFGIVSTVLLRKRHKRLETSLSNGKR